MSPAQQPGFAGFLEAAPAVLAHDFEQVEARGRLLFDAYQQRLRYQAVEEVVDLSGWEIHIRADRCRGFACKPSHEYCQASQQRLLAFSEQLVAPVDGRPQGLLAQGRGPRPHREQAERVVESSRNLSRRHR